MAHMRNYLGNSKRNKKNQKNIIFLRKKEVEFVFNFLKYISPRILF